MNTNVIKVDKSGYIYVEKLGVNYQLLCHRLKKYGADCSIHCPLCNISKNKMNQWVLRLCDIQYYTTFGNFIYEPNPEMIEKLEKE